MEHTKDSDCTVDPTTLLCSECGVDHSDQCLGCGGRGFHKDDCPNIAAQSTVAILLDDPTEVSARAVLWNAANYLYANQFATYARVQAMDFLDNLRRESDWSDMRVCA